jgi:hypothetical protein
VKEGGHMQIPIRFQVSKPWEAPPEMLPRACTIGRSALEKPEVKPPRLFYLDYLFQWKTTKSPNKQTLSLWVAIIAARASHSSFFFEKFKNYVLKFQKIPQTILDVARYVSYNCVKFQFKIPYTLGCTKTTKMQI